MCEIVFEKMKDRGGTVSIEAKAELTNESVNYDTKTKAHVPK